MTQEERIAAMKASSAYPTVGHEDIDAFLFDVHQRLGRMGADYHDKGEVAPEWLVAYICDVAYLGHKAEVLSDLLKKALIPLRIDATCAEGAADEIIHCMAIPEDNTTVAPLGGGQA
jgi:hypothetical protein